LFCEIYTHLRIEVTFGFKKNRGGTFSPKPQAARAKIAQTDSSKTAVGLRHIFNDCTMHQILNTLHSYNRYLLLAALVFVLYRAYTGWLGKKAYAKADNSASAALVGLAHLQLLLGSIQYFFTSAYTRTAFADMGAAMKNEWLRYFAVEHIAMMTLAVACIQVGRTLSKKAAADHAKHRKLAIWTSVAVLLIVASLAPKGLLFSTLAAVAGQ
jgi:hypothetical protein